jgi:hypothetical protein
MYGGNSGSSGVAGHGLEAGVTTIDGLLADLAGSETAEEKAAIAELRVTWLWLLELRAARSKPEVHLCPVCSRVVMHAATLCTFCWGKRGRARSAEATGAL